MKDVTRFLRNRWFPIAICMSLLRILYGRSSQEVDKKSPQRILDPGRMVRENGASTGLLESMPDTTIYPPCNTSGTHYFFGGKYHQYPDSVSFRRALLKGTFDTPQYKHDAETSTGLMYTVTGAEGFIRSAFVPVIEHLRNTVGIPDVPERRKSTTTTRPQPPQQWSIAMDPFTCNLLSEPSDDHPPILPFFDVLLIFTHEDLRRLNRTATFWDPVEHTKKEAEKVLRSRKKSKGYGVQSRISDKKFIGVVSWEERFLRPLRHYVMGYKMLALRSAPFPITTFMDVDLLPCRKDFDAKLVEHIQQLAQERNYSHFDIAVTDERPMYAARHPSHEDPLHYMSQSGLFSNTHNTMCTVLNTTSPRTRYLLELAINHFFEDENVIMQPSFGLAMHDTWNHYRSENNRNKDSQFRHIDMSIDRVCRNEMIMKGLLKNSCPKPGEEDNSKQCLLVHKTTGESEEHNEKYRQR